MGKFKTALQAKISEEREFEQKQEELKKRHNIENDNVIVVEKRNFGKFLIKTTIALIRTVATILLITLATIGAISLIYPNVRGELFNVLYIIVSDLKGMVGL